MRWPRLLRLDDGDKVIGEVVSSCFSCRRSTICRCPLCLTPILAAPAATRSAWIAEILFRYRSFIELRGAAQSRGLLAGRLPAKTPSTAFAGVRSVLALSLRAKFRGLIPHARPAARLSDKCLAYSMWRSRGVRQVMKVSGATVVRKLFTKGTIGNRRHYVPMPLTLDCFHLPSKVIGGGSTSASNALAVLVKPRCASAPLYNSMARSSITRSAAATPPLDHAFSRVRVAA
jgi:hypothetical protein